MPLPSIFPVLPRFFPLPFLGIFPGKNLGGKNLPILVQGAKPPKSCEIFQKITSGSVVWRVKRGRDCNTLGGKGGNPIPPCVHVCCFFHASFTFIEISTETLKVQSVHKVPPVSTIPWNFRIQLFPALPFHEARSL